jgi:hypothetical protein
MITSTQVHNYTSTHVDTYTGTQAGGPLVYLFTCLPVYLELP